MPPPRRRRSDSIQRYCLLSAERQKCRTDRRGSFGRGPAIRCVIASVSQLRASAKLSGIAFPAASTVRSNCRPHAEQVNVCRSYSRAFSAAGDRRVRNVRLPQFAHGGLSCAPKPRAIRTSSIMTGPPTRFRIRSGHANVSIEGLVDTSCYESTRSSGCSGRGSWQATTRPLLSRRIMSRSGSRAIIAWYTRRAISSRSIRLLSAAELSV